MNKFLLKGLSKIFDLTNIICIILVSGQLFSIGVLIWQMITNMQGFWFYFSLVSVMGYAIAINLMRAIMEMGK
jgi:hypothetical protein